MDDCSGRQTPKDAPAIVSRDSSASSMQHKPPQGEARRKRVRPAGVLLCLYTIWISATGDACVTRAKLRVLPRRVLWRIYLLCAQTKLSQRRPRMVEAASTTTRRLSASAWILLGATRAPRRQEHVVIGKPKGSTT